MTECFGSLSLVRLLTFRHNRALQAHPCLPDPALESTEEPWFLSWRMVFRNQDLSLTMLLVEVMLPPGPPWRQRSFCVCVCAHLLRPHIENHEFSPLPPLLIQFCRAFVLPFLTVVTLAPIVLGLVTEAIRLSVCNKPPMPPVTVSPAWMSSSPQHRPVWALKPAPCWALPRAHQREIEGAGGGRRARQLPAGSSSFQGDL